ncbi:MAG: hypothetical protein CVV41_07870 [Candidatus Riflebacteria bacterium HGW-Riflebacteria-1]|jgi:ankyrin repeat protein|nr:MAG: hypothetical protein CVV41_07870 [Candidatus Riflebacteria bacterium HGW-Riflebacteria-1]
MNMTTRSISGFSAIIMLLFIVAMLAAGSVAADFETQLSCPVCRIDYPAIVGDAATGQLAIDGQPLAARFLPLPECPLCGGVFGDLELSGSDMQKLESFIWAPEHQNDRKTDTRLRFARLLEQLERDSRQTGLAYLQAAWASSENPQQARSYREKSLELFKEYLTSPEAEEEQLFDISLKIADSLRQLQRFEESEAWLKQMQTDKRFQQAWYPMLLNHTLELIRSGNSNPAALPAGNRLHNAIAANDIEILSSLLAEKKLMHEIDTAGLTPLLLAINNDNNAAARLLLEAGAELTQTDTRGNTPLHLAAQRNNREIARLLLDKKANPDSANHLGQTPLHVAIETLNPQIAGLLLTAGANLNRKDSRGNSLLHMICHRANPQYEKILEAVLKHTGDVNQRNFASMTPLHIAALHGSVNMLRSLVKAGAKVDARIADGSSALFFCRPELTETLLELGADINLKNNAGLSAFVQARLTADQQRIAAFKKTGRFGTPAQPVKIQSELSDIFSAAKNGQPQLVTILNEHPEQVNIREISLGETPLHLASAGGHALTVRHLLDKGAAIDATNDFLRTPLHYAATMGHLAIVKTLCEAKANIHALDARGTTPLHDAAAAGHRKIYNYLIQLGASDSTLDNEGRSAASLLDSGDN